VKERVEEERMRSILARDPRYAQDAYFFVREGLEHTVCRLNAPRHVSGRELLEGLRKYALEQFGPLALRVLNEWGISECIDFGHVVFNLVEEGLLGKTEEDRLEDFSGGYEFREAFLVPFLPESRRRSAATRAGASSSASSPRPSS